jgi:pilus assembly protein Flp/PilA
MRYQAFQVWVRHVLSALTFHPPDRKSARMEAGQGLVEYALLIVLVGVIVMAILVTLGPTLSNMFQNILNSVESAN